MLGYEQLMLTLVAIAAWSHPGLRHLPIYVEFSLQDVDGHLLPLEAEVPPTMPVQRMPPPDAGLATGLPHGIGMASPGA